jgi:flagellar biosynthesis protein FlhB
MPEQFGDKRHEATPFRRQQAREQGQIPRSQDLASAVVLVGALLLLIYLGRGAADFFFSYTETQLRTASTQEWALGDAGAHALQLTLGVSRVMLPILALLMVVAAASHIFQVGFLFLPQKAMLDWNHINPLRGMKRILSLSNVVRLGFGLIKTALVLVVGGWCIWQERAELMAISTLATHKLAAYLAEFLLWTCLKVGVALLILALLDYGFQYWKHEQDLRMTDQEMRDELKTLQGDPQIVARRRAVQRQLVLNRLSTTIPVADFVVTNPTELAVAVRYDMETMPAPIVVAKGAGVLAQRIRRLALENGVPIIERKELARALYAQVDVNQPIPTDMYAAVAEILRYVYQLKGKTLPRAAA